MLNETNWADIVGDMELFCSAIGCAQVLRLSQKAFLLVFKSWMIGAQILKRSLHNVELCLYFLFKIAYKVRKSTSSVHKTLPRF